MKAHQKEKPELDLIIVGAGFAGMYMLHRARQMNLRVKVLEAASDVGGTWWWNRYPGARCDVESVQYSYSWDEELQQEWNWSERFAAQPEILAYARHVAERFDFRRDIKFNTRVIGGAYDEADRLWTVEEVDGTISTSRYIVLATGCLSAARVPDLPGMDAFQGETYHTGAWPHEGVDFTGKRVAVIGTGSSGIQVIPEIAKQAKSLTVFQRTPNFSVPARNQPLSPEYVQGWKSNYSALRRKAREDTGSGTLYDFPTHSALDLSPEEREREYRWRWEKGGANFMHSFNDLVINEDANKTAADFVRARIRDLVKDPNTAELLCPSEYPIFTKRICVDSQYYETFNRDNVRLLDLKKTPIETVEATGIRTSDKLREFDAIVYATGFDAITGSFTSIELKGRNGVTMATRWKEGPKTYLGLAVNMLPNVFMVTGPGSPSVLSNVIVSIEQHVDFIANLLETAKEKGVVEIEAQAGPEAEWVSHVNDVASATLLPRAASWYMGANIPGKARVFMPYIGVGDYRQRCNKIAADGYSGFSLITEEQFDLA